MGLNYDDAMALARRMAAEKEGTISREYFTGKQTMTTDYERGFTEAIEKAVDVLGAYLEYDRPMCCDGRECGCQGASVFDMIKHYIRALSPSHDTVRVPREPTEAMLEAALDATGERILPFAAERECGVPVECDISEEDALAINEGTKTAFAEVYRAMIAAMEERG